ncbi:MAG: peptidyl-prolyl cis-trans isomerase [Desulfovibrionales bacterium]|nr:peptidyl-prolyl cis-trans isomerase [Desulfovibrionales bacterium]
MKACAAGVLLAILALATVFAVLPAEAANMINPQRPQVKLTTNEGVIVIELYPEHAPKTVKNFLRYVHEGFYDGTIFHRVEKNFALQGGGYDVDLKEKQTWMPVENEANNGLHNAHYTVAMARTSDPNSATSQFFINLADNPNLDYQSDRQGEEGYAVFGRVVQGEKVVDRIEKIAIWKKGEFPKLPVRLVVIEKAREIGDEE